MRLRISPIQSHTSRRDREFLTINIRLGDDTEKKIFSNLGHRDEIKIYYSHSQASRRERKFPSSDLGFWDENKNVKSCHLSLNSDLSGLTNLPATFGRLTILNAGLYILLHDLPFEVIQSCSPSEISLLRDLHFAFPHGSLSQYCQLVWCFPSELYMVR